MTDGAEAHAGERRRLAEPGKRVSRRCCMKRMPFYTGRDVRRTHVSLARGVALLAVLWLPAACAQRVVNITSEPSGALIYINGEEAGRTPFRYDFTWYGDYDIVVRADGYETLKTHRKLDAPLYGIPPFDLFGEMFGARDVRRWHFELQPASAELPDPAALIARGYAMRGQLRSSRYTRAPSTLPATLPATRPLAATP